MKNFSIILFIFFILFLMGSLFINDPMLVFLVIFLAFILSLICLIAYLGKLRGIIILLSFIILPFLIEYLFHWLKLPLFETPLISTLNWKQLYLPININSLFLIFTLPLLFMSSLFFVQKIKIFSTIKNFPLTFLIISNSILICLNFLIFKANVIIYQDFLKWLLIALITNLLIAKLYSFKADIAEIYKELPIIIYLAIYGVNALRRLDSISLIIAAFLTILYLYLLYKEYKIRQLSQQF